MDAGVRGAWSTALVFTMSGAAQASWMSRLPAVLERLDTDLAGLGFALLALGVGTLLAMPLTGRLCQRFSSQRVVTTSSLVACAMLAGIGAASSPVGLGVVLFLFGVATGAWDAAMNIQGSIVERRARRHWLTRFHGCWSLGSVAGAGMGVTAARADVPVAEHLLGAALVSAVVVAAAARTFVDDRAVASCRKRLGPQWSTVRQFGAIAGLTWLGATVEGAAGDWLAIYMTDVRNASHADGATAYAIFVGATAVGRFAADGVYRSIGLAATVRWGAVVAAVGAGVAVIGPVAPIAYLGALCWGLGICVVFPAALSASGRVSETSDGVAVITTVGYSASLLGPPCIGALADVIGLGPALLLSLPLLGVLAVLASSLNRASNGPAR